VRIEPDVDGVERNATLVAFTTAVPTTPDGVSFAGVVVVVVVELLKITPFNSPHSHHLVFVI